jgi:hypothetical protein
MGLILGITIGLVIGLVLGAAISFPIGSAVGIFIQKSFSGWALEIELVLAVFFAFVIFNVFTHYLKKI